MTPVMHVFHTDPFTSMLHTDVVTAKYEKSTDAIV